MICMGYGMALYGVYVYMIWLYINDVMYVIGYCDDPIGIQTTSQWLLTRLSTLYDVATMLVVILLVMAGK